MRTALFILLYLFFFTSLLHAQQAVSSTGKEFHLSFFGNSYSTSPEIRIYLSSKVNTSGTIANPNTGYSVPFTIAANNSVAIPINSVQCTNLYADSSLNQGLIITSNDTIAVHARNAVPATLDVSMILPTQALSTSYIISNTLSNNIFRGIFLVQATENNTQVEIVPSVNLFNNRPAGQPFTITLNRGQTYMGTGAGDLSGTTIRVDNGCKPIAVFSGSPCAFVPSNLGTGCEHLYEQILPDYMLGLKFITPVLKSRNSSRVRVTTAYDGTTILRNGLVVAGPLTAKTTYEFETNNTPQYIEASLPVQVGLFGQSFIYDTTLGPFNNGDPTFILVSPADQLIKETFFSAPGKAFYEFVNGVSVICKTSDITQMQVDGQNISLQFVPVAGNILYSQAFINIDSGYHYLQNTKGFQAYVSSTASPPAPSPNQGVGWTSHGFNTAALIEPIINHFSCNGFSSKDTFTVEVCKGPSTYIVTAPQPTATFTWNFGDGSPTVTTPGSVVQQIHSYFTGGTYVVTLTIVTSCNVAPIVRTLKVRVLDVINPTVKIISAPDSAVCQNQPGIYRAVVVNAGANPGYLWSVNGVPAGTNNAQFGPVLLNPNDLVKCVVTSSLTCVGPVEASDTLRVKVLPVFQPNITIATPTSQVCQNMPVTFTAQTPVPYVNPRYLWRVNGVSAGSNNPVFTYTPSNNDEVSCVIFVQDRCAIPPADTSNSIFISIINSVTPNIIIQAAQNDLCVGSVFNFTAFSSFGGANPVYDWRVNGVSTGINTANFSSVLNNNDTVTCLFTSSFSCVTIATVVSNPVVAKVRQPVAPVISISTPRTNTCRNELVNISASVSGAATTSPTLNWYVNGTLIATNSTGNLQLTTLQNNDTVYARSSGGADCLLAAQSNKLIFRVTDNGIATAVIQTPGNGVCTGNAVRFTAQGTNGGANPQYRWLLNGVAAGSNTAVFTLSNPRNNDRVQLEFISSNNCVVPVLSNVIDVRVFDLPVIRFNRADTVIRYGTSAILNPTIQSATPIVQYNWLPADRLNNPSNINPVASPLVTTRYRLTVTDQNDCSNVAEYEVKVTGTLQMPTAFSPNGDGMNDRFIIPPGLFIDLQNFAVYNRWGQVVFSTNRVEQGWDGFFKGTASPAGVYAWTVQYRDAITSELQLLKGTVVLIR
jgi:gliding motility-associated-like protein